MNERQPMSRAQAIRTVLEQAEKPLTFDELLDSASVLFRMDAKGLKTGLNNLANNYSTDARLIQRTAEGQYGWLPKLMVSAHLRHTLTQEEFNNQWLLLEPEIVIGLFPLGIGWGQIESCTSRLPDANLTQIRVERVGEKNWKPIWGAHVEPGFWGWLASEHAQPGDAIVFKIEDGTPARCSLTFEARAARDEARVSQRNAALADAAFSFIKSRRRGVRLDDLSARLLALGVYHDDCPPDLLEFVLENDTRFRWERGEVKQATRYDHLYRALGLAEPDLFDQFEEKPKRSTHPRSSRKELAHQVYRFWAAFRHNKALWRRIEIRGDQSLGDLDRAMRAAFGHDLSDHLSEFDLGVDAESHRRGLGRHNPFEESEGDQWRIGELGLAVGDELSYTYDFGDNIQHVLKLDVIVTPEPRVKYPRVVEQNKPRYRYCALCKQEGKKEIAAWICLDCSNEEQREVLVCEGHLASDHEDHYAEELVC